MKIKNTFVSILLVILAIFAFATPVFAQGVDTPPSPAFDWTFISELLQSLALATIPVLAGMGAKLLSAKISTERAKFSAEQNYMIDAFIRTAVYAAEQLNASEQIDNKLDYVLELVDTWLINRGIELDLDEIRARIEAEVKQAFPKYQEIPAPVPTPVSAG